MRMTSKIVLMENNKKNRVYRFKLGSCMLGKGISEKFIIDCFVGHGFLERLGNKGVAHTQNRLDKSRRGGGIVKLLSEST